MQVVWSPQHHQHDPHLEVSAGLPVGMFELPVRADTIHAALDDEGSFTFVDPTEHGRAPIEAVHDPGLVSFLETAWRDLSEHRGEQREVVADTYLHPAMRASMGDAPEPTTALARLGYRSFDTATPLVEGTYAAARVAVDVVMTAADLVLAGEPHAYALCRPPGHHATRAAYGGYCFFNNAAVAAHAATTTGTTVTVLDIDYHHGNGTQQIFYERDDVQYVSIHGDPNRAYPYYVGHADEVGAGPGRGANLNLPLAAGTDDDGYLDALDRALAAIAAFGPGLLIVSLGVDTYRLDPISDFACTTEGYLDQGRAIAQLGLPTVVVQEGGYHVGDLGANVRSFLTGIAAAA